MGAKTGDCRRLQRQVQRIPYIRTLMNGAAGSPTYVNWILNLCAFTRHVELKCHSLGSGKSTAL